MQEKFAEALIMVEGVSEPELSDSTTEEDELVSVEIRQLGPGEFLSNYLQLGSCDGTI